MDKKKKISQIITIRLFIAVFIAFIVSGLVTYAVLYYNCVDKAAELMQYTCTSLFLDIKADANTELFRACDAVMIQVYMQDGEEAAAKLLEGSDYSYVAKPDGTIYLSGNEAFIGKKCQRHRVHCGNDRSRL